MMSILTSAISASCSFDSYTPHFPSHYTLIVIIIQVHENVIDTEVEKWCSYDLPAEISLLLRNSAIVPASDNMKQKLIVECIHISRVKSYAPHVIHVVADLVLRQAKAGEKSREQREGMGVVMAVGVGTSELGLDM